MTITNIYELAEELRNLPYNPIDYWQFTAHYIRTNPDNYKNCKIEKLEDRVELREIGKKQIPRIGDSYFEDNEFYEEQSEEYKSRFPEFKDDKVLGTFEKVKDVFLIDSKHINITWEKYLIVEKEKRLSTPK